MADVSAAESAVARWAERFDGGSAEVRLREVPFLAQVNLRVDPAGSAAEHAGNTLGVALPTEPNTVARTDTHEVLWLGPDEWLVLGPEGTVGDLAAQLRDALADAPGSVVDVSAQRTIVEVSGARARELLAKGCSLDLHPRVFRPGQCAQTLLARAGVILLPREAAETTYWVFVRTTFADYLARWLLDARREYAAG